MDDEIQLISDGAGVAVIGDPGAVERFLAAEALPSRPLDLPKLRNVVSGGSMAAQAGSELAANSGRWVKLTEESAQMVKKYGLMESKTPGVSHAMVGKPGEIKGWLQIAKGPGSLAANPALLAGAAGVMAQLAMQQAMDEVTDYLERIDEKLDDILRAQKDTVLAQMIGIGLLIDEAMTLRSHVGRVNEVTWTKVQAASGTIAETQAYALLQLDALAEKLESKAKVGDLATAAKAAETKSRDWLAVLARCFQLQDAIAVLELDRVLETAQEDLDGHRLGLKAARQDRLATISRSTEQLMRRLDAAAGVANTKVLAHPSKSRAVVHSRNHVGTSVLDFQGLLGIESGHEQVAARRWVDAASDVRDKALEVGAERVDAAKRFGNETRGRARSATERLSSEIAQRTRRRGPDEDGDSESRPGD
jgi:rRNA processing protein Krr1/Pno1